MVYGEYDIDGFEDEIIDEASYITFNRHLSELLFKIIADRAEKRSAIISTNLKFSEWTTLFENETMVAALIDRLTTKYEWGFIWE
ncbi:ATP-binding protein [Senegalia massiliensis]|uniref:ATP-binding protein n=1 Tax=Senegalia massiliensis TaxID=1720316 RepID=UPI00102FD87B|nr:ATP-binding protein [Senegalia massiliensis]